MQNAGFLTTRLKCWSVRPLLFIYAPIIGRGVSFRTLLAKMLEELHVYLTKFGANIRRLYVYIKMTQLLRNMTPNRDFPAFQNLGPFTLGINSA